VVDAQSALVQPRIGDFFVVRTNGWLARIVRFGCSSTVNHAGVYVGNGQVVEARPGGAGYKPLSTYLTALWSTDNLPTEFVPTDSQRQKIVANAVKDVGTPYGMLDILAIALGQKRLGDLIKTDKALDKQPWWVRRLVSRKTLICSQLVDLSYKDSGIHFFTDLRIPGLVSPEDLRELLTRDV
jgi:cell wall-associated NlpC family hydrolase